MKGTKMNRSCKTDHDDFPVCVSPPDPQLIAEGWERRFIADAKRAQDAMEMYVELGHEVRLEPVNQESSTNECSGCWLAFSQFKVIYTRKRLEKR
jgi:hypothetical protein